MSLLNPALRQRLTRARLVAGTVSATGGVGERRSRMKGEGIEFEDHREYQPGDDMRRLDPHLYARFGEAYVRQYNVGQQLTVTLLVDLSASMAFGAPSKLAFATAVATGLSVTALAGSDTIQAAFLHGTAGTWLPRMSGLGRLEQMERWLATAQASGPTLLASSVEAISENLTGQGICVLISDLWSDDLSGALDTLDRVRQSLIVIHVLAAEELEPGRLGSGPMQLADSETGEESEVTLGPAQVAAYKQLLEQWIEEARQQVLRRGGAFVTLASDTPIDDVFMRVLPSLGVLR